ncbi:UNVERIFIED_CONTAM: hypothetical protein Sindi_2863300 [Sesamum indicum]
MHTRSRARDVHDLDAIREAQASGMEQNPPGEQSVPQEVTPLTHQQTPLNGGLPSSHQKSSAVPPTRVLPSEVPPQEPMIRLTQEALLALIQDASTRAAAQAVAQFVAQQPVNPPPPSPRRSRELSSAPEEEEQRREEVNKALPAGLKVSNLSEYDGTGDPQEHLDKIYAKIDWYDLSDAAYCKVFRTTLSQRALAWFNQLPAGTISSLEQLVQRFLHHFPMNKKVPKTAAYLFTIRQREGETLRDFMQRFVDAVHEVPHVNQELLASIVQQNLQPGRFKESIAGKPPSTMEDLLVRSQKYIRIEESNALDPSLSGKGRVEKRKKSRKRKRNASMCLWRGLLTIPP